LLLGSRMIHVYNTSLKISDGSFIDWYEKVIRDCEVGSGGHSSTLRYKTSLKNGVYRTIMSVLWQTLWLLCHDVDVIVCFYDEREYVAVKAF
jgi:hypothetical protein